MISPITARLDPILAKICRNRRIVSSRCALGTMARNGTESFLKPREPRARAFAIRFLSDSISNSIHNSKKTISLTDRRYSVSKIRASTGDLIDPEENFSHLLTKATARQLKGDIDEAILLASKALSMQKKLSASRLNNAKKVDNEEIADTVLFLGKLHQLNGSIDNAVELFAESRYLCKQEQVYQQQLAENHDDSLSTLNRLLRKEFVALSHLASAKARLLHQGEFHQGSFAAVEAEFQEALEGLSEIAGWQDGITNHTAHEWALYCKNVKNDPEKAIRILSNMKEELSKVFGGDDERVLQLNGEMAQLWRIVSMSKELGKTEKNSADPLDVIVTASSSSTSLPDKALAEKNAMALLEEALDALPPNSPEARRLFMQLEEWKESQEGRDEPV